MSRRTGIIREFREIAKDVSEPRRPYIFRAELANHRFLERETAERRTCSGKGLTVDEARASALGEAVERYSGASWDPAGIRYARRSALDRPSLDPRRLVLYLPGQYPSLPYAPYDGTNVLGWVPARSLMTGEDVLAPALAVYMSYEVRRPDEFICPITSNGLAAGASLLEAVLAATYEILERDAFLITWLNRLPCRRVDPWRHPDEEIVDLCEAYRRRRVEMELYRVPTDHPACVFAALGVEAPGGDGPAVVVGLGADLDPDRAARKAILEVGQVRPALRRRLRQPETRRRLGELAADPRRVTDLEDHDLLYASHASLPALDFIRAPAAGPEMWAPSAASTAPERLHALVDHLRAQGQDLLYVDLTPPDMRALGLWTARAIVPGFQPIDFGWLERRLAGERLYELPRKLGFSASPTTPEQLNAYPHPIA